MNNYRRHVWLTHYAPLFVWIGIILFLGSGQGAMSRTSLVVRPLLEFFFPTADEATFQLYHGYIRKFAHFAEYAILAVLAFRSFSIERLVWRPIFEAVLLIISVAALDEMIQTLNPTRTGAFADVLIDISGGIAGAICWYLYFHILRPLRLRT